VAKDDESQQITGLDLDDRPEEGTRLKPRLSYTIWCSPRAGGSLLCRALQSTGVAGNPREWFLTRDARDLLGRYGLSDYAALQEHLWDVGSTPNGVWGVKASLSEPTFSRLLEAFRRFPGCPQVDRPRATIWEHAFPNSRHIFLTRRNMVPLAVSWWKAAKTQEWIREQGCEGPSPDLSDAYSYEAIDHLYNEASMREAGMQEFFSEGGIVPLTLVYEDFIQEYEETVKRILDYLELDSTSVAVAEPYYAQLADDISEDWVQRFREERQQGWENRGW
jgi:LPS sulfotransferase NodH